MAAPDTTFWQVVAALTPLVGIGGIGGIIAAVLGYKRSVATGGRQTVLQESTLAIGVIYSDRDILEQGAKGLDRLSTALESLCKQFEGDGLDELRKLRRALEDNTESQRHPRK